MKKVLLSSVVALSVFAAAAPAFAADKVEKDTTPSTLKISDLPSTGQVAPSAPASAATEKHPGATQVDPKVGKGEVIEKKGDVSSVEYDGEKNADTSKELTAIPGAEWFTQGLDLWNGSQHVTLKTKADTPSGFYATAVSGSLRPAGKADAKAPASKEEAKATEAKAGKAGSAGSAEAGKALPKTSAVK